MDLIADIGATNARCALLGPDGHISCQQWRSNLERASPGALLRHYLDSVGRPRLARAALSVAAPVSDDDLVRMVNIDWVFSKQALQDELGVNRLLVCNDFVALAHALPALGADALHPLQVGRRQPLAPRVVIGPGTGLGASILVPLDGERAVAVPGEGGHVTLAARTAREQAIITLVQATYGHVSAERLISGPGLARIHAALQALDAGSEQLPPAARWSDAATISAAALAGDRFADEALETFFLLLATTAGNLAVTTGAFGGVYLAGGILPRLLPRLERSDFVARFIDRGRYRDYLTAMPLAVITHPLPAFPGLQRLLQTAD
jgi:glucokinase